jgi:hypothetical protein
MKNTLRKPYCLELACDDQWLTDGAECSCYVSTAGKAMELHMKSILGKAIVDTLLLQLASKMVLHLRE